MARGRRPGQFAATLEAERVALVLLSAGLCLLGLHYLKFFTAFQAALAWLAPYLSNSPETFTAALQAHRFFALYAYLWWGFWHLVFYALVPAVIIRCVLRDRLRDYGLRLGDLRRHLGWYLLLCAPILVFVIFASKRGDFSSHYPFYRLAARSWFDLVAWECIYLFQFVCLEFFFRGFMLFGCRPVLGRNAVWVMAVPYLMIHFAKPWPEASGALLFGVLLGLLALRSGSIWGGVLVHCAIALSMDLAALLRTGGLPGVLWP